ncbi:MAG: hypothetical protein ACPGQS_02970 [Bradymonadia bacterium]
MKENKNPLIATACLLGLVLLPAFASGQTNVSKAEFPDHIIRIYGPSDPNLNEKLKMEQMMGVYLTHPPRRHKSERITIKRNVVTVHVWQSIFGMSNDELKCRAVEWLVFGRTQYGQGGRELLSRFPEYNIVNLRFHEVVRPKNSRRKANNADKVVPYLSLNLRRKHLRVLELEKLKTQISDARCRDVFKLPFEGRLSTKYTKSRRNKQ